ncbi:NUDIX domain-containing protein [Xanthobacter sp. AM11]|uniref:NUDIX domain-containing protein n=1 Tax=Xanthobacter sp. AM11 TaxID=3380643 RepID=UPI0039BED638
MRYACAMLSLLNIVRRVRHGMTLGVRVLACDDAGRLLLVRHTYVSGWHLPGGGVDLGETAIEAAHRELREETNVEVAGGPEGGLSLVGLYFNPQVGGRDHVALFQAGPLVIGPRPERNLEIVAAEFFTFDALPEDLTPATRRRLSEWREGAPRSHHW